MNCKQESGVFLNQSCSQIAENSCDNCDKQICSSHTYLFKKSNLCEDCYWERYLYNEADEQADTTYFETAEGHFSGATTIANSTDDGFAGGFGGGDFGGGGASGEWSEGDAQSFDTKDTSAENMLDNDDTFYYS